MKQRPPGGGRRSRLTMRYRSASNLVVSSDPRHPYLILCCRPGVIGARIVGRRRIVDGFSWCRCCHRILTAGALLYVVNRDGRLDEICPDCAGRQ